MICRPGRFAYRKNFSHRKIAPDPLEEYQLQWVRNRLNERLAHPFANSCSIDDLGLRGEGEGRPFLSFLE